MSPSPDNLMIRTRKRVPRHLLSIASLVLLLFAGCKTRAEDDDTTNTYVVIDSLGVDPGVSGPLFSDVCSGAGPGCTVVNDNAIVTMSSVEKDDTNLFAEVNDVIIERYRVTYIRSDGRNVPGADVPYPFDGVVNFRIPIASDGTATFIVVRHQAKLEPPLSTLAGFGGALVLTTLAEIEFFGHDLAGRPIKVTGYLNITFGDFP